MSFVDPNNSQSRPDGHYAGVINQIAKDGVCPFCPEHLANYHKNPVVEREMWLVTDNMYPYKPSKLHRLIIHKEHITHMNQITPHGWHVLMEILGEEVAKNNVSGGSLIMRFGDTKFTGASVSHLHMHIVQSDPDDPSYDKTKGLTMRIG